MIYPRPTTIPLMAVPAQTEIYFCTSIVPTQGWILAFAYRRQLKED